MRTRVSPLTAVSIDEAARASSSASPGRRARTRRERTAMSARNKIARTIATGNRPTVWRFTDLGASTLMIVRAREETMPRPIPAHTATERAFFPRRPRPAAGMKRMTAPSASIVNSSVRVASLIC